MQEDFHYYATYSAAYLAGYTHDESRAIAYSAQFVDHCTKTILEKIGGPVSCATTQLCSEMAEANTDIFGLQYITRIWSSFHFLPYDLEMSLKGYSKMYRDKRRLVCDVNSKLLPYTVELAKDQSLEAVGVAMHVLADTWAHRYFAGTPSLVINNINNHFFELFNDGEGGMVERQIHFHHNPAIGDDIANGYYTNSIYTSMENTIMSLGHGRVGHLPDMSFIKYKYMPAWGDYDEIIKDNPRDYMNAFCQMVYALKYLRGEYETFELDRYDRDSVAEYEKDIMKILTKRQVNAKADWKVFARKLTGHELEDFDISRYDQEYMSADAEHKHETVIGRFLIAAQAHKAMITQCIFKSKNLLAGFGVKLYE